MKTIQHFLLTTIATACSLLLLQHPAAAQDRIVEDRKVFVCTMSDRDTFKTADAGCRHFAKEHLGNGYKYEEGTAVVQPNGAVKCLCTKSGSSPNDQQGIIMGEIICPENASELDAPYNSFEQRKCQCYQTYVASNGKCVKPEDVSKPKDKCETQQGLNAQQKALKDRVVQRLQELTDQANQSFAKDPTVAKGLFTPKELAYYGRGGYLPYVWNQGYGQAVERLTDELVKKDRLLNGVIKHVPNVEQTAGRSDFEGQGQLKNVDFDVTTPEQAERKKRGGKECWEFITYKRLIDANGKPVK